LLPLTRADDALLLVLFSMRIFRKFSHFLFVFMRLQECSQL